MCSVLARCKCVKLRAITGIEARVTGALSGQDPVDAELAQMQASETQ